MDELAKLRELTRPTSIGDLRQLQADIETHLDVLDGQRHRNEFIDVELARDVAKALVALTADADRLTDGQRALLRGAIDYFLLTDDADDDLTSPIGLEDDARVVNHVCDQLGRTDVTVDVPD
jgi:hypothetical protein